MYDYLGNVQSVCYQKNVPSERLTHYYTYDADQRLSKVETGIDDPANPLLPHTEQARYDYYLHGPLKRIVYGRDLQGVDYTYTVQGWLKAINNSQTALDPSQDSPGNTGILNDLFGTRLDYFNGDFSSRQLIAPATSLPYPMRYDGTLSGSSWSTSSSPIVNANAYRYDVKGQLLESGFGQLVGGNTFNYAPLAANSEGNLSYEPNGNIQTLRRRDGSGVATADYIYNYILNSNKLSTVKNQNAQSVITYSYERLGQVTAQQELDPLKTKYLEYDVSGKVTAIFRDAAKSQVLARYVYDEFGRRISQQVYDAPPANSYTTTYYVRDAAGAELASYIYSSTTGQTNLYEQPIYGASRLGVYRRPRGQETAQQLYELNDQLGNTRVVFRRPEVQPYDLTMEGSSTERSDFPDPNASTYDNVRTGAYARSGTFSMGLLNQPNLQVGPSKTLTMQRGDKLHLEVYAGYPNTSGVILLRALPIVLTGIANGLNSSRPAATESTKPISGWKQALTKLSIGLAIPIEHAFTGGSSGPLSLPQAALQYVVRRADNNNFVRNGTALIDGQAEGRWEKLQLDLEITENYPVKVEVSVQNYDTSQKVYFDDLSVKYTVGPVVAENNFYAYGLRNEGLSWTRQYLRSYGRGYQGQYTRFDEETGYDNFELRNYDARIGRWASTDPMGQYYSPYMAMGNDPVNNIDPTGGFSGDDPKTNLPEVTVTATLPGLGSTGALLMWDSYLRTNYYKPMASEFVSLYQAGKLSDGAYSMLRYQAQKATKMQLSQMGKRISETEPFGKPMAKQKALAEAINSGERPLSKGAFNTRASTTKLAMGTHVVGGALLVTGVVMSAHHIYYASDKGLAVSQEAGGWAGSLAGAEAGAYVGGIAGAWFGGVGAAPGAVIGGLVGGAAGYFGGYTAGGAFYNGGR